MAAVGLVDMEYRSAFEEFSQKARRVQSLTEHPTGDRSAFESALLELERAHLAYDRARDSLVNSLLDGGAHPRGSFGAVDGHDRSSAGAPNKDHRGDVQALAELLWVSAGRPTGTAEQDWLRAEAIVERALAGGR